MLIAALGLGTWAYFVVKNSKKPTVDALAVLPNNCLVYIKVNNFFELNKKLNSQSIIIDKLKNFNEVNTFCNSIHFLDSLLNSNKNLYNEINETPIHIAFYDVNWLLTFNIIELGNQEIIEKQLVELLNAKKINDDLFEFELIKNQKKYFNLNLGVVCFSNEKKIILSASNKKQPKLINNEKFLAFKKSQIENELLSIYINHNNYGTSKINLKLNLNSVSKHGYSQGSIDIKPSEITLNGFLMPDSTDLFSLLLNQTAPEFDFLSNLPIDTKSFKAYGFSSFSEIKNKSTSIFPSKLNNYWKELNNIALYNLEKEFYENIENYLIQFETATSRKKFTAIKLADTLLAPEHLKLISESSIFENEIKLYKLITIDTLKSTNLFYPLLTDNFTFASFYKSFIYFSESKIELAQLINDLKRNNSFINNENFITYKNNNLPERFNFISYTEPNQLTPNNPLFFNFNKISTDNAFENFKHFSFSLTSHKHNFNYRCHFSYELESSQNQNARLWSFNLQAPSTKKITPFINHLNNENEFVIQDDAKALYLINAKGNLIWKKVLNENIESQIYTVDVFKNNKYQLLFNTKNYLHLIDRNGKYLEGYPLKLISASSSPLSLIDFNNDKNYRLFIACANNFIYNYSISGKLQEGFLPFKTKQLVVLKIQQVKIGEKDYIVALDNAGQIYALSRKGELRINFKNKIESNCQAFYIDAASNNSSSHIIYYDQKNNSIQKISFSDKKNTIKLNALINAPSVSFASMNEKKTMNLLLTTNLNVQAYDFNGNLLFENNNLIDFKYSDFYNGLSQSFFYSYNELKNTLFILDQHTLKIKKMSASSLPLISNLFNDNKLYIVAMNGQELFCEPINN